MTIPVPREIPLCGVCIEREKTKFGTGNINQAVYRVILPCRTPGCPLPYHMPPVKGNLCLECLTSRYQARSPKSPAVVCYIFTEIMGVFLNFFISATSWNGVSRR